MAFSKKAISANLNAFLDGIAWAEGTSTSTITLDDGYDIIVTGVEGKERFNDYSRHPFSYGRRPKKINDTLNSTASGRYQHMLKDYVHYRDLLKLPDFSPLSQDRWAIQLLRECKALPLILAGKIKEAVAACRHLWASLPGAGYNQPERKFNDFLEVYLSKGGLLWDSLQPLPDSLPQSSVSLQPLPLDTSKEKQKPLPMPESNMANSKPLGLFSLIKKLLTRN